LQNHYTDADITAVYNRNVDSVYRVCFVQMKNKADAEDITQEVFLKLLKSGAVFENSEHEKAWLIRVAVNLCRNSFKAIWRRALPLNEALDSQFTFLPDPDVTIGKVMNLPANIKTALCLFYYEGYPSAEIARIMGKPESTVRGYLHRGRSMLKKEIELEEMTYGL